MLFNSRVVGPSAVCTFACFHKQASSAAPSRLFNDELSSVGSNIEIEKWLYRRHSLATSCSVSINGTAKGHLCCNMDNAEAHLHRNTYCALPADLFEHDGTGAACCTILLLSIRTMPVLYMTIVCWMIRLITMLCL
jgi:hypothetical protein